jgi:LppX_LprAFG lipoprotein
MFSSSASVGRSLAVVLLFLVGALLFTGCSLPWQQSNTQASGSKPTAQQLLVAVQKNFRNVSAFHVVMQASNTGTPTAERIQILNASGDVVMPDKVKAQATVILSGQSVTVNLISIGNQQFITDPITGQWRVIKGLLDPRTLTNPNTGLISLVSKVQNLSQPTDDSVNGIPCWRMTGQLDAKYLAFFTGGGVPAGTMLQTSACIGKSDSLPYQLKVTGQAAAGDLANTTRTFLISNYNEKVSITAPQI